MSLRLPRPCLTCGRITTGSRCPVHRRRTPYRNPERQRMAHAVAQWVKTHGFACPGYRRAPHASRDLTADHVVPVAHGGTGGPLAVLCRACNTARRNHQRVS